MREVELKFAVDRAARSRLAGSPALARARPRRRLLTTLYFDTPEWELRSRGMALRLRHDGTRWIQSLKAGASGRGGLHSRDEWEFDRATPGLELALFADTPLAGLPDPERLHERLAVAFEVDLVRTAWIVAPSAASRLEVVLDEGEVRSGPRGDPLCEVEIECLAGDARAAFDLAETLLEALPLRPSAITKAQRGYRLVGRERAVPVKARPVALDRAMAPVAAAREIVGAALEQLQANEEGVLASDDPEYVHQARVALRRMRSALRMFRAAIGRERSRAWRDELAQFAAALGGARDWDVFALETLPPVLEAYGDASLARRLRAEVTRRRRREREAARAALASARYARAMLAVSRWISRVDPDAPSQPEHVPPFAARVIRKRHDRFVERARHLAVLDPQERHRVRIDAKRLRYGVEGLASLFESRAMAAYRASLAHVQDALGDANDAVTASRLLGELDPPPRFLRFARRHYAAHARGDEARVERLVRRLAERGPPAMKGAR